jgi:hypothetical protein
MVALHVERPHVGAHVAEDHQDARIRALILLGESVDQPDESVSPADAPEIAPITIPRSP